MRTSRPASSNHRPLHQQQQPQRSPRVVKVVGASTPPCPPFLPPATAAVRKSAQTTTSAAPLSPSSSRSHRADFLAAIVSSAVQERGSLRAFDDASLTNLCVACGCTSDELFEQEKRLTEIAVKRTAESRALMKQSPRERLEARVHYNPPFAALLSSQSSNGTPGTSSRGKPAARSVLRDYIRRPNAGKESEASQASRTEVLNLRRVLNEVQLQLPALARLQQQRKLDLETEGGQAESFTEIFSIIDEDGSGEIDLDEFVAFGRRIGGESAKVFSAKLYHRIVKPEEPGIALGPFIALLFPAYASSLQVKEKQQAKRAGLMIGEGGAIVSKSWMDDFEPGELHVLRAAFQRIDTDGDGVVSAREVAEHALGKRALEASNDEDGCGEQQLPQGLQRVLRHVAVVNPDGGDTLTLPQFAAFHRDYLMRLRGRSQQERAGRPAAFLNDDDTLLAYF